MKLKLWFIVLAVFLAIGLGNTAFAFHSGGVADCAGCHSMHGSYNVASTSTKLNATYLLTGSDQSSTCLNCHGSSTAIKPGGFTVMTTSVAAGTAPIQRTPGGDFGWLLVTTTTASSTAPSTNLGSSHGHNIIAADYGLTTNGTNYTYAPASGGPGSYPSANLYCNSCHDPHNKMRRDTNGAIQNMLNTPGANLPIINSGSYPSSVPGNAAATAGVTSPSTNQAVGVYRILAGYPSYSVVGITIPYYGAPIAIAPSSYNQPEGGSGGAQVRVAYGVGGSSPAGATNSEPWGKWCASCHTGFDSGNVGTHFHPIDGNASLGGSEGVNYTNYVGSGNMQGTAKTAYLSLVPFMTGSSDVTQLAPLADNLGTVNGGPGAADQVSCLTCHRAHASGWPNALRWNTGYQFITYVNSAGVASWPGTEITGSSSSAHLGYSSAQVQAAMYDRTVTASTTGTTLTPGTGQTSFAGFQRSLCNKCHAQD